MSAEIEVINSVVRVFLGIGFMSFILMATYAFYQLVRFIKPVADKETKYELFEEMSLDKMAKKKGIDLDKEEVKRDVMKHNSRSFRKRVEEEIYTEMFGKDKEDKE